LGRRRRGSCCIKDGLHLFGIWMELRLNGIGMVELIQMNLHANVDGKEMGLNRKILKPFNKI
jgi:hypothetical protein